MIADKLQGIFTDKIALFDTLTVKVLPELSDIDIFFATLEKLEQCVASLVIPPLGIIASTDPLV